MTSNARRRRSEGALERDELRNVDGAGGFTAGIQRLLNIFEGSTLRVLANAYIKEEERELFVSLWNKGLRRLRDPAMFEYQKELLRVLATGGKWEPVYHLFPQPMTKVIVRCILSRSVDGRGMQVMTDMHTGFNTAWLAAQQSGLIRAQPSRQDGRALRAATRAGEDDE